MRKILVLLISCFSLLAQAQEVSHTLTFGVGTTNVYDDYLSPLEYTGTEARIQRETFRQTHLMDSNVYVQTQLNAHASYGKGPNKSGKMYEGMLNWNIGWLYQWQITDKLTILAGPMADLNGGVIYNKRNSNNPAQAKAYVNADISGMAFYRFRMFKRPFRLRYQVSVPVVGLMFSPEYGESYYEMFELKNGGWHNLCLTTPFSQPSLRHSLYLDFTLARTNMRVGYMGDLQQSSVNRLKSHTYSHAFMVGFTKNFIISKKPIQ